MKSIPYLQCLVVVLVFGLSSFCRANGSVLEGRWSKGAADSKIIEWVEFSGKLTASTRSYYPTGEPSDYFFAFDLPEGRDILPGEVISGRIRSVDGLYGCLFDEPAQLMLTHAGTMKLHFPILTFHRVTRSVREQRGERWVRYVDWTGWGWVEYVQSFPIEKWRVVSSECVIDHRNPTTQVLKREP